MNNQPGSAREEVPDPERDGHDSEAKQEMMCRCSGAMSELMTMCGGASGDDDEPVTPPGCCSRTGC